MGPWMPASESAKIFSPMKSLKISHPVLWLLIAIENGPFSSVDLPIKNGGSFHSYVNVYQRLLICALIFGEPMSQVILSYNPMIKTLMVSQRSNGDTGQVRLSSDVNVDFCWTHPTLS